MKVYISFESSLEEDYVAGETTALRGNIYDLTTLAQFLTDAVRGAGFDYVVDVGFEKDDGEIMFGKF